MSKQLVLLTRTAGGVYCLTWLIYCYAVRFTHRKGIWNPV